MKEEITIQSRTQASDGQGGYTSTWATLATEWAQVTEISSERLMLDGGVKFGKVREFQFRERGDTYTMSGAYRIYWNGDAYTVYSIITNDDRTIVLAYTAD